MGADREKRGKEINEADNALYFEGSGWIYYTVLSVPYVPQSVAPFVVSYAHVHLYVHLYKIGEKLKRRNQERFWELFNEK